MSVKEKEQLGKFNVHVEIVYADNKKEEFDVHRWVHSGDYLALDMFHTELKVINCKEIKKFCITPMEDSTPSPQGNPSGVVN